MENPTDINQTTAASVAVSSNSVAPTAATLPAGTAPISHFPTIRSFDYCAKYTFCLRNGHTVRFNISRLPKEIQVELRQMGLVDLPVEGVRLSYGGRGGFSNQATLLPGFRWSSKDHAVYAVPAATRRTAV